LRVIINRTDAIGDTLLTLPMAKFIKENYTDAKVAFIVSPKCLDLFNNHPYVDECWVLDHKLSYFKKMSFLKNKYEEFKADAYFHVGGSHLPSYCAWKKGIKFRGGLKSKWQSFVFLNKAVRQSRSLVSMHESDYNLNLLGPLGISYKSDKRERYAPKINITVEQKEAAFHHLKEDLYKGGVELKEKLVVIHPGMMGHTLNWSSRNYARLISRIEKEKPDLCTYLISFTPGDEKFLTGLRDQLARDDYKFLEHKVHFFNGLIRGLSDYMAVLSRADLFIGPSTGTTHIANTLGIKLIGLYSPIKVQSALRWGPFDRNEKTKIIVPDVVCGEQFECSGRTCPYFECMAKIEVEDVYNSVEEFLG